MSEGFINRFAPFCCPAMSPSGPSPWASPRPRGKTLQGVHSGVLGRASREGTSGKGVGGASDVAILPHLLTPPHDLLRVLLRLVPLEADHVPVALELEVVRSLEPAFVC